MIKSAFKDSFGNAGQMRKRLPCLCLRRTVDGIAIVNRASMAYRSKSEEVKLEVTRAPTIRLRLCNFLAFMKFNFTVVISHQLLACNASSLCVALHRSVFLRITSLGVWVESD